MKQLILATLAALLLTSCATASKTPQMDAPNSYTSGTPSTDYMYRSPPPAVLPNLPRGR